MCFSSNMDSKNYLIEIIDFYKYKLTNDLCTMEEINSVAKAIEENLEVYGTISDFAKFYGVNETTVRTNIFRKMFAKPKRKLLYPFHKFARIVPSKWRKDK